MNPNPVRIIVVCGGGVATSVMATTKIREMIKAKGLNATVDYKRIADLKTLESNGVADIYVGMTKLPDFLTKPVVNGVPMVTGIGADKVMEQITNFVQQFNN